MYTWGLFRFLNPQLFISPSRLLIQLSTRVSIRGTCLCFVFTYLCRRYEQNTRRSIPPHDVWRGQRLKNRKKGRGREKISSGEATKMDIPAHTAPALGIPSKAPSACNFQLTLAARAKAPHMRVRRYRWTFSHEVAAWRRALADILWDPGS